MIFWSLPVILCGLYLLLLKQASYNATWIFSADCRLQGKTERILYSINLFLVLFATIFCELEWTCRCYFVVVSELVITCKYIPVVFERQNIRQHYGVRVILSLYSQLSTWYSVTIHFKLLLAFIYMLIILNERCRVQFSPHLKVGTFIRRIF